MITISRMFICGGECKVFVWICGTGTGWFEKNTIIVSFPTTSALTMLMSSP